MTYTIKFDDASDLWIMDGFAERFVDSHLGYIAYMHSIDTNAISESHLLAILQDHGIKIDILDSDGSRVEW